MCPRSTRGLASRLRALDLRFPRKADEAGFKANLEQQVLWALTWMMLICIAYAVLGLALYYPTQVARDDLPFRWGRRDPRTFAFGTQLCSLLLNSVVLALASLRLCCRRLRCPSGEPLATFTISCFVIFPFFIDYLTAALSGVESELYFGTDALNSESNTLLRLLVIVSIWALYFPVRSCVLWMVPACGVFSYGVVVFKFGPRPKANIDSLILFALMCYFSCRGAYRHERDLRERWLAGLKVKDQEAELETSAALTRAVQQVGGTLSDIVVQLSEDLCVVGSNQMHSSYFGKDVEGQPFTDMLVDEDEDRFANLVQRASQMKIMQSMSATLDLVLGQVPSQLVVVDTLCAHPRYLVAVQTGDEASTVRAEGDGFYFERPAFAMPVVRSIASASATTVTHGGPASVEFDALSPELTIISATPGWVAFCGATATSTGLAEQLEPRMLADFRIFLRQLVGSTLSGMWDVEHCTSVYQEMHGTGPDGTLVKAVWEVTVPDPDLAYEPDVGRYPMILSLSHSKMRSSDLHPAAGVPRSASGTA